MPEYLTPGVYVEELPAPQTIEGVSTSDAGFVGAADRGQTIGLPQLVTSFGDFQRKYGGHLGDEWGDARYLAFAVEGFFTNGGQRAYISRVVGAGAMASNRTFSDGFNTRLSANTSADAGARSVVQLDSITGISAGSALIFSEEFAGTSIVETRFVRRYDASTSSVTLDDNLGARYTRARCTVTMLGTTAPGGAGSGPSLRVEARNEGTWGDSLEVTPSISYGATGLTAAAAIDAEVALTPIELAFAAAGPAPGATIGLLDATPGFVDGEGVVRFGNAGGDFEIREVAADGATLTWDRPLANDYSAAGSSVVQLSDVLRPPADPETKVQANDLPEAPADGIELTDVTGIAPGDVLELRNNVSGELERVVVAAIAGNTITGTDDVDGSFPAGESTVTWFPSIRANVDAVAGLGAGDLVRIIQGVRTQVLSIAAIDGTELAFNASAHPLRHSYDAASAEIGATRDGSRLVLSFAGSAGSANVDLRSARNFYERAVIEIDDGSRKTYHQVASVAGDTLTLTANLGAPVPHGAAVRIVELSLRIDDRVETEAFVALSLDPSADNYAPHVVNLQSRLVRIADQSSALDIPFNLPQANWSVGVEDATSLQNGDDGAPPTANDYIGVDLGPARRTGIEALVDIDAVAIIAAPGVSNGAVQGALLSQCEARKDRFAVLDPLQGSVLGSGGPDDIVVQRSAHDSLYGAIYYPWVRVRDPLDDNNSEGVLVPPSGHMLGIYARVDNERGVHKAPANEVIRGLIDPGTPDTGPLEVKLSDREQAVLNPANINALRDFRGSQRGLRCWGARVMTSDSAWKYVPVRRLFIYVEESLYKGLQWVVFEPNADPLWARARRTVSGFLRRVWLDGALEGLTEEEAFFVRCDLTTMTPDDIASGRLIVLVGIAPVKPAEFVVIRISQKTREAVG
jgi:uncharacterized protein